MIIPRKLILTMALGAFVSLSGNAQLNLSSTSPTIEENFNSMWQPGMAETESKDGVYVNLPLPSGWKIDRNLTSPRTVSNWDDASTIVMYNQSVGLLNNAKNGTYCWGDSNNIDDRAVGGLTTGSVGNGSEGTRGINLMTKLTNNDASKILTYLTLDYNIEKYRTGNNDAGFSVRIYSSPDGKQWTEAEDIIQSFEKDKDTAGAAVVPISSREVKGSNIRVHVEPKEDIYLAWNISVTSGSNCASAQGLAIDDVVITGTFADSDDSWVEEDDDIPSFVASGIYMRGLNGIWDAVQDWEFSKLSDTEYALYNKTLSGTFKVADKEWSASCNYGSNGSNITMGEPYTLEGGSNSSNISCGSLSFPCSRILLTIKDGNATLLLEPNTKTTGLSSVYMVGDFNKWDYMSTTGKLTLDPTDNLFKGEVPLTAGTDGLSHWMIYQRLALAGAWGLDKDATTSSTSGTLVAGQTGHAAVEPGMYEVEFNLTNGAYTLTKKPSTAYAVELSPAKATLVPELPEKVKVLSLNNSLIHYNDQAKVFNDIATAMGKDAVWTKHTNLGKTLQYHWEEGDGMTSAGEPGAKMMIRSDAWSHIILQEQTALPRTNFDQFKNSVAQWVDYIRTSCPNPNAVIILPLNWALAQDWSNFNEYNKILVENYGKVAQELGVVICPVGLAYQSKYDKDGNQATEKDWFLPGDDRHPTLKATYLAALMEYGLIFNEDPTKVTYYPNYTTEEDEVGEMSEAIAAEMRQYAKSALDNYSNVVNHHSKSVNISAKVVDQFGIEMPNETVTYTVSPNNATITNGVFTAPAEGEYTITATSGNLSAKAVISVATALTEVPDLGFIGLSENNLSYSQDFDSMGYEENDTEQNYNAPIPEGWRADGQLTERTVGSYLGAGKTTLKSANGEKFGSTLKNGVWNFGDSSDLSDRALGGATTDAAGGAKSINIYAAFKNEGTKAISSIDLDYNIEKYRYGSNPAGFTVQLYTSVDGYNWKSAGSDFETVFAPDAETIGADETPIETRHVAGVLEFDMVPGAELFLAWNISASTGTSCQTAPILAIDDVEINANLKPVPVFDNYIYIENQSPYQKTALYAWSENEPSEILGAWPGQNPIDVVTVDGVTYEVFGHNQATGNYHIIYNNNNNGAQYNDFDIEAGQDYYLRALPDGKTMELQTSSIDAINDLGSDKNLIFSSGVVYCDGAFGLALYNLRGTLMMKSDNSMMDLTPLPAGIYVATATTSDGVLTKKIMKN